MVARRLEVVQQGDNECGCKSETISASGMLANVAMVVCVNLLHCRLRELEASGHTTDQSMEDRVETQLCEHMAEMERVVVGVDYTRMLLQRSSTAHRARLRYRQECTWQSYVAGSGLCYNPSAEHCLGRILAGTTHFHS